jgi:hypothetical protein
MTFIAAAWPDSNALMLSACRREVQAKLLGNEMLHERIH